MVQLERKKQQWEHYCFKTLYGQWEYHRANIYIYLMLLIYLITLQIFIFIVCYIIQNVLVKDHHWIILNSVAGCFKNTHVCISVGLRSLSSLNSQEKVKNPVLSD